MSRAVRDGESEPSKSGAVQTVGPLALYLGFLEIALSSFGGALAWTRQVVVERRGWLNDREFAEQLGICQVLPGGNIVNLAVWLGSRFAGLAGALAALAGLLLAPLALMLLLGQLYSQGAELGSITGALRGATAVAVGILMQAGLKLAVPYRRQPLQLLFAGLAVVAVGVARLPLIPVLLVLAPLSIAVVWRQSR